MRSRFHDYHFFFLIKENGKNPEIAIKLDDFLEVIFNWLEKVYQEENISSASYKNPLIFYCYLDYQFWD